MTDGKIRTVKVGQLIKLEGRGVMLDRAVFAMGEDEYPGAIAIDDPERIADVLPKAVGLFGKVFTIGRPLMSGGYPMECIGWAYLDFNHHEILVLDRTKWSEGEVIR